MVWATREAILRRSQFGHGPVGKSAGDRGPSLNPREQTRNPSFELDLGCFRVCSRLERGEVYGTLVPPDRGFRTVRSRAATL